MDERDKKRLQKGTRKQSVPKVREDTEIGIRITAPPHRTEYVDGERFVKTGMRVEVMFVSGKSREILDYVYKPCGALCTKDKSIEICYLGHTAKQKITVREYRGFYDDMYDFSEDPDEEDAAELYDGIPKTMGIYVCHPPKKKTYFEGECFDPNGMQVMTYLSRGMPGRLIDDFDFYPKEPLTANIRQIEIRYGEFTDYVVITVIPRECEE